MPARMTSPPACLIAAGMTSSESLIAEAPKTTTMSLSRASDADRLGHGAGSSCGVRRSAVTRLPERASRASVIRTRLGEHAVLDAGQHGLDEADPHRPDTALTAKISPPAQIVDDRVDQARQQRRRE